MRNTPMMKCGHAANAISNGKPCCIICFMTIGDDSMTPMDTPDLTNRRARCSYYNTQPNHKHEGRCDRNICHCEEPSSSNLAFFEYRPNEEYDRFYCGCFGWD
jgi:hypothetical protein